MWESILEQKSRKTEQVLGGKRAFLYNMKIPEFNDDAKRLSIVGLDNGHFSINNMWVPGAIICFPKVFYMWGVTDAHEIKPHTLDIFKVIKPKPTYVIIGTGKYNVEFPEDFYNFFKDYKIKIEIMPTFEAVTHFNMCNEDELNIAAALVPINL